MRYLLLLFINSVFCIGAELSYIGSSTIGKTFFPELSKLFESKTKHHFTSITNPGSGKGIDAILEGKAILAGASRSIKEDEREKGLRFFVIGYDAIGIITNHSNPINSLTSEQIADLFSGKIKNWKELGWKDVPVQVVVENLKAKRATQVVFTKIIFKTKQLIGTYATDSIELDLPLDEVNFVSKNEGAIAAVSMTFTKNQNNINVIPVNGIKADNEAISNGSYPISRPLVLVTSPNPPLHVQEFLSFVYSKEAQSLIAKNFVSARESE